jgi:hypothetical protein
MNNSFDLSIKPGLLFRHVRREKIVLLVAIDGDEVLYLHPNHGLSSMFGAVFFFNWRLVKLR